MIKQFFQIFVLWLAGFSLLGHSIIPHHHHNEKEQSCHHETHKHETAAHHDNDLNQKLSIHIDDCINHDHDQEEACSFNVYPYIEHNQSGLFAILSSTFIIEQPDSFLLSYFSEQPDKLLKIQFDSHFGRAPPAIC